MYCVKCGVKLKDHVTCCPLCQTPVWNPDAATAERSYPQTYPKRPDPIARRRVLAGFLSALTLLGGGVPLMVCLRLYRAVRWAVYPLFGVMVFYCIAVLPMWFRKRHPVSFLALDFAAVAGYLYLICRQTGGAWFWPFALPITATLGVFVTLMLLLIRHTKGKRLVLTGVSFWMAGVYCLLVEAAASYCFGLPQFLWSLYPFASCALIGTAIFVIAAIRPLRAQLERLFFY